MSTTVRARTARVAHLCEGCHWTPSLRGVPTIAPGHRYLLHTAFPNAETNQSHRPYALKECVACASERDSTAGLLVGDACSTFCCGDVPCARPHPHDGNHSCRRCAFEHVIDQGERTMLNREEVKVGDVIEVPPGVDVVCTTRYRIRVDELAAYGPYGPRVKADGSPMQSRSVQAENGLVMRVVPWDLIPKCIRHPAQQSETTTPPNPAWWATLDHAIRCAKGKVSRPRGRAGGSDRRPALRRRGWIDDADMVTTEGRRIVAAYTYNDQTGELRLVEPATT